MLLKVRDRSRKLLLYILAYTRFLIAHMPVSVEPPSTISLNTQGTVLCTIFYEDNAAHNQARISVSHWFCITWFTTGKGVVREVITLK